MNDQGFFLGPVPSGDSFLTLPNPSTASSIGAIVSPTESDTLNVGSRIGTLARATRYGHASCLYIPERIMPPHREHDVLEFTIARDSDSSNDLTLYARHRPGYRRAYVDLFGIGARPGEKFLIKSVSTYPVQEFACAYNRRRPAGLENTEMSWTAGRFLIIVSGEIKIPLNDVNFTTFQGRVILNAKLGDGAKSQAKIAIGGGRSSFKLADKQPVVSLKNDRDDVVLGYKRWENDARVRLRLLQPSNSSLPRAPEHEVSFRPGEIEIDRPIEHGETAVNIVFTEEARHRAWKYWALASSHNERKGHQGDIGEAVACAVLEKSGYRVVERHTVKSSWFKPKHQCRGLGRDILALKEGRYHVVEAKHWKAFPEKAIQQAEAELILFSRNSERKQLEQRVRTKINRAFAMQLDWSYTQAEATLHSKDIDLE